MYPCVEVNFGMTELSSVISIAGAIVTILYIPDNHWALLKLGKTPLMKKSAKSYIICLSGSIEEDTHSLLKNSKIRILSML